MNNSTEAEIVQVGEQAPDFWVEGFDAEGKCFDIYTLHQYAGRPVLLFFYPGNFTYVCPTELVALASMKNDFDNIGLQVLVISTDSKFSHKRWNESELSRSIGMQYPYPMLSDASGSIGSQYNIFCEKNGVNMRGIVLIDKNGIVQLIFINAPTLGRNPHEILRFALALKMHEDSGGKAIPACWVPGNDVIDPSFENSGNVCANYEKMLKEQVLK